MRDLYMIEICRPGAMFFPLTVGLHIHFYTASSRESEISK